MATSELGITCGKLSGCSSQPFIFSRKVLRFRCIAQNNFHLGFFTHLRVSIGTIPPSFITNKCRHRPRTSMRIFWVLINLDRFAQGLSLDISVVLSGSIITARSRNVTTEIVYDLLEPWRDDHEQKRMTRAILYQVRRKKKTNRNLKCGRICHKVQFLSHIVKEQMVDRLYSECRWNAPNVTLAVWEPIVHEMFATSVFQKLKRLPKTVLKIFILCMSQRQCLMESPFVSSVYERLLTSLVSCEFSRRRRWNIRKTWKLNMYHHFAIVRVKIVHANGCDSIPKYKPQTAEFCFISSRLVDCPVAANIFDKAVTFPKPDDSRSRLEFETCDLCETMTWLFCSIFCILLSLWGSQSSKRAPQSKELASYYQPTCELCRFP